MYGAISVDEDLTLFIDRHGKTEFARTIVATISYLKGNITRRGVADGLEIPAVEGIAVTQAVGGILAVIKNHDPTLSEMNFAVDIHERTVADAPYQRDG